MAMPKASELSSLPESTVQSSYSDVIAGEFLSGSVDVDDAGKGERLNGELNPSLLMVKTPNSPKFKFSQLFRRRSHC